MPATNGDRVEQDSWSSVQFHGIKIQFCSGFLGLKKDLQEEDGWVMMDKSATKGNSKTPNPRAPNASSASVGAGIVPDNKRPASCCPAQLSPLHEVLLQGCRSPLQGVDVAFHPVLQAGGGGTLQLQAAAGDGSTGRNQILAAGVEFHPGREFPEKLMHPWIVRGGTGGGLRSLPTQIVPGFCDLVTQAQSFAATSTRD